MAAQLAAQQTALTRSWRRLRLPPLAAGPWPVRPPRGPAN